MRTAIFWAFTQRVVIIPYQRFGTAYPIFRFLTLGNIGKELPLLTM